MAIRARQVIEFTFSSGFKSHPLRQFLRSMFAGCVLPQTLQSPPPFWAAAAISTFSESCWSFCTSDSLSRHQTRPALAAMSIFYYKLL
jgi:hypothetical protein